MLRPVRTLETRRFAHLPAVDDVCGGVGQLIEKVDNRVLDRDFQRVVVDRLDPADLLSPPGDEVVHAHDVVQVHLADR